MVPSFVQVQSSCATGSSSGHAPMQSFSAQHSTLASFAQSPAEPKQAT
jgi:hypothetical protein